MKHQHTMTGISTTNYLLRHCFTKTITTSCYPHTFLVNNTPTSTSSKHVITSIPSCNLVPRRWGSQVPTASSSLDKNAVIEPDLIIREMRRTYFDGGPSFTKAQAVLMIEKLTVEERKLFLKELKKVVVSKEGEVMKPTRGELRQLAYHNSLPFIGFGFLDNFIMIIAGEYIDLTLGAKLGISTMAAAAFGNTISDMMGIGSAWYVESWADKLGAHPPDLTPEQLEIPRSRICANLGRGLGVAFGCFLGMFPLLFIDTSGHKDDTEKEELENV
eukprot:GFUD01131222.1.p1 GENE.GFUD01131222.1~~GFUD01131222.1.p1  ORF type:complete len:273 (+),score=53.12 GFUD01131222.1:55-873(+)